MSRAWIMPAAVVAALGLVWWWFQPPQVLKRRSTTLIELVQDVRGGARLFDISALDSLIADEVVVEVEALSREPLRVDRSQVLSAYQWMGNRMQRVELEVAGYGSVRVEGERAVVDMRVDGMIEMPGIRLLDGSHRVRLGWVRGGDGWRLVAFAWIENAGGG